MPDLYIGGIAMAPVIAAIVEGFKRFFGMPSEWAPFVNTGLSIIVYVGIVLFGWADLSLASLIVNILILILTAAGLYTTAKWARARL